MAQYVKSTADDAYRATQILDATSNGQAGLLHSLMNNTALSINLAVEGKHDGATPLHIAARKRQVEIVRWIRDKRGERNMNVQIESGFTPLHAVIADSDKDPPHDPLIEHYASPEQVVMELLSTGTSTIPVSIKVMLCAA
jgi:ankyrin repeat protein